MNGVFLDFGRMHGERLTGDETGRPHLIRTLLPGNYCGPYAVFKSDLNKILTERPAAERLRYVIIIHCCTCANVRFLEIVTHVRQARKSIRKKKKKKKDSTIKLVDHHCTVDI